MKYVKHIIAFFTQFKTPCPRRDWFGVLFLASVLGLGFVGFGVYLFLGIQTGFIFEATDTGVRGGPAVTRDALSDVIELYETRLNDFQEGNIPSANVPDPR